MKYCTLLQLFPKFEWEKHNSALCVYHVGIKWRPCNFLADLIISFDKTNPNCPLLVMILFFIFFLICIWHGNIWHGISLALKTQKSRWPCCWIKRGNSERYNDIDAEIHIFDLDESTHGRYQDQCTQSLRLQSRLTLLVHRYMNIWLFEASHSTAPFILAAMCFWKLTVALYDFRISRMISNWRCHLWWLLEQSHTIRHNRTLHLAGFLPIHLIVHITTLWKCIEMRTCMLLYLICACDAIRTPLLSIICGVSVPHSERLQWGYFSQPSIQTWPITARLQKHFLCTQELTALNGGHFQSLCCQSKCQVNTGQWKQL